MAEGIDALLHVADAEIVVLPVLDPADRRQDLLLEIVAVLVLVAHDFPEMSRQLPGRRRPSDRIILPSEDLQRKVLEIREIDDLLVSFLLREPPHELLSHVDEGAEDRFVLLHENEKLFRRRRIDTLFKLLEQFFHFRPAVLKDLPKVRILAQRGLFARKSHKLPVAQHRVAAVRIGFPENILKEPDVVRRTGKIGRGAVRLHGLFFIGLRLHNAFSEDPVGIGEKLPVPGRSLHLRKGSCTVLPSAFFKPYKRPGLALRRVKYLQDVLLQEFFGFPGRDGLHQRVKSCSLLLIRLRVGVFQQLLHHVGFHERELSLLRDPKARLQFRKITVGVHEVGAEAVDRRDLRVMDELGLPVQMLVVRVFLQRVGNRPRDPLLHLAGRRLRECHDQQLIDVHRMFRVQKKGQDAGDKNRRLAAAGRGRNEDIGSARVDDALLFICPLHFSSSIAERASSSSMVLSRRKSFPGRRRSNPQIPLAAQ